MNKRVISIIFVCFCVALIATIFFYIFIKQDNQNTLGPEENKLSELTGPIDIFNITNEQIVGLLQTNTDTKEYIERYKDFKIESKTPLTKESIIAGQNGENFKEVYQNLDLENGRFLRIDLMNTPGDKGLIVVLDSKTKSVIRVFGLLLMKTGVN